MTTIFRCAVTALLTCAALAAPAAADQPASMTTSERDCAEINSFRVASPDLVDALLPEGWSPFVLANGRAQTRFLDYTCEAFSVDGLPARRTIVSWFLVRGRDDATGELRFWTAALGTDNPLYVQRLRKLGLDARYMPRSTVETEAAPDGRTRITATYLDPTPGGPGLDYSRTYDVAEPSAARTSGAGPSFWFDTEAGLGRISYVNDELSPTTFPTVTERFGDGSLPRSVGIGDITRISSAGSLQFNRGSWTATLERLPG